MTFGKLSQSFSRMFMLSKGNPNPEHQIRYDRLREKRNKCAQALGIKPFRIASNRIIREMAGMMPETLEELGEISGVGPRTLSTYGDLFLAWVRETEHEVNPP